MFTPIIRPNSCTISNLSLASWLMFRGARLEGLESLGQNISAFTFTHKRLSDFIHEYEQGHEVRFSPKVLFQFRDDLKKLAGTHYRQNIKREESQD